MRATAHPSRVSCLGLTIEKNIISHFYRKVKSDTLSSLRAASRFSGQERHKPWKGRRRLSLCFPERLDFFLLECFKEARNETEEGLFQQKGTIKG
jgi:hypothetical protein